MANNSIEKEWSFDFDYSVSLGETYTRFMEGLKEKKLLGNRCGGRVFFPPRPFCDRSFELADKWLEGNSGTVEAFTIYCRKANSVLYPGKHVLPEAPYAIGVIKIDNSEQCLIHFLSGFGDLTPDKLSEKIKVGMRVRPVWASERFGNILDIEYFEPAE